MFVGGGGDFVSLSPKAIQISWNGNIDICTPESRTTHSPWMPGSLQFTVMCYNSHTWTYVSPDDSVMNVSLTVVCS